MRRALAVVAVLATGAACVLFERAPRAAAPPPQTLVALDYEVGDATGCPDADEFRASVARQLRYDPFRPTADRRVGVVIARKDAGFDGRISWTDADGNWVGERRLSSRRPDCREIAASVAFSVAVQIQLLTALAPPAPEPPPPPPPPPPPAAVPTVLVPPPPPPPVRRLTVSIGLGPALALGLAPEATGIGRLFVDGRVSWFSLELSADAALPTSRQQTDGSSFSLARYAAGAAACGHARALAACATTSAGILRAHGGGVDVPASPTGWFAQVGARITATYVFAERYFASARADGLVMLSPSTVTLNQTAVWTTPRVGALIGLDLGARF